MMMHRVATTKMKERTSGIAETDIRQQQQIFIHQQKEFGDVQKNPLTPVFVSSAADEIITTVHPHDVLCGRRGSNHYRGHEGNKFYRTVICEKQKIYFRYRSVDGPNNKDREEKSAIIQSVVDEVKGRNPPGRFLKAALNTKIPEPWVLLDRKDCLAKVGHALLDKADRLGLNQYMQQNKMMIKDYTPNDILLGNGKKYKIHDGNHWYRELICSQQPSYDISEKLSKMKTQDRMKIIQSILDKVEARSPPGRFLQVDCNDNTLWYQIEVKVARKKIRDDMKYRSRFLKMKFQKYGGQQAASSIVYKAKKFNYVSTQTKTNENVIPNHSSTEIIPLGAKPAEAADLRERVRLRVAALAAQSEELRMTSIFIQQQLQRQVTPQRQLERQMELQRAMIEQALQHRQTVQLRLVQHHQKEKMERKKEMERQKQERYTCQQLQELIRQEQERQLTQHLHRQRQQQLEDQRLQKHVYQLENRRLQTIQQQLEDQRLQIFQQQLEDQRLQKRQQLQLQQQLVEQRLQKQQQQQQEEMLLLMHLRQKQHHSSHSVPNVQSTLRRVTSNNRVLLNYSLMNRNKVMINEKEQTSALPILSASVPENNDYSNLILVAAADSSPKRRRIDSNEICTNAAVGVGVVGVRDNSKQLMSFSVAPPKNPATRTFDTNGDDDMMITDAAPTSLKNNNNNTDNRIELYNFVGSESSGDDSDSEDSLVI